MRVRAWEVRCDVGQRTEGTRLTENCHSAEIRRGKGASHGEDEGTVFPASPHLFRQVTQRNEHFREMDTFPG